MRLLFFIHSLHGGGAERVTSHLANHWAELGWEVGIATLTDCAEDFYQLHPAIERMELNLAEESQGMFSALVANYRRVRALRRLIQEWQPEAVIAMMTTANVILALAGLGLKGVRRVGSERCYPPLMPVPAIWELLRRWTYGYLDVVVAQTTEAANWLAQNTKAKSVEVIPNPVIWPIPASQGRDLALPERTSTGGIILAVGRLSPEKGFDLLLDAYAALLKKYPAWKLAILGEGPSRAELDYKVQTLGIGESVSLPGRVGNISEWYQATDIFVLSSRTEGFPNALLEAMAAGMSVVSFACRAGPKDLISDGVNGLLANESDVPDLSEKISWLLDSPHLRTVLGNEGIRVREKYSLASVAKQWECYAEAQHQGLSHP